MTFHRTLFAGIAAAAVLAFAAAIPAHAQTLDAIKKRGVLIVGTQGGLQTLRLSRSERRHCRDGARHGQGRRRQARRQTAAGAGCFVQPHAVSAAGQDRPDDRDDERHAGAAESGRHRTAGLLRLRRERDVEQEGRAEEVGADQGPEDLRHPGRLVQQVRRRNLRRRDRCLHRHDRSAVGAAAGQLHRLGLRRYGFRRPAHRTEMGRLRNVAADNQGRAMGPSGEG